jgi:hypothetical protein
MDREIQLVVGKLIALALAVLFATASVAKARSVASMAEELRETLGFGGRSAVLCLAIFEGLLAVALFGRVFVDGWARTSGLTVSGFVVGATAYLALRLITLPSTDCRCWGGSVSLRLDERPADAHEHAVKDMLQPAWHAGRNALLVAAGLLLASSDGASVHPPAAAAIVLSPLVLIAAGLLLSITREHRLLSAPEHPLVFAIAPRARILVSQLAYMQNLLPNLAGRAPAHTTSHQPSAPLPVVIRASELRPAVDLDGDKHSL